MLLDVSHGKNFICSCSYLLQDDHPSVGGVKHIKQLPLIEAPSNDWSEFSVWTPLIIGLEMWKKKKKKHGGSETNMWLS